MCSLCMDISFLNTLSGGDLMFSILMGICYGTFVGLLKLI